jgi:hypothetical protein
VTVNSSTFGNYLDHGLDLIHPPLWYLAWGMGLPAFAAPVSDLVWPELFGLILVGYVSGRLLELAFRRWVGHFSIFCWRPVDSYFRLVVARRNSNLLLLSGSLLVGRPDWGLVAVALWTILSAVFLSVRLALGTWHRRTTGPLRCWLEDPHLGGVSIPLGARPFVEPVAVSREKL